MRARELATEKVNPKTVEPGFKVEKKLGNLRMVATGRDAAREDGWLGILIKVYDDSKRSIWPEIATARLIVDTKDTADPNNVLKASFLHVDSDYRRQGIASAMYNFARELGNDVAPSSNQSSLGRAFWTGGGGVGKGYNPPPEPVAVAPEPKPTPEPKPSLFNKLKSVFAEGTDFTNAVNSIEKLIKQNNIEFKSYEELLKFVASRKFLQSQRNDQQFINDVTRSVLRRLHQHQVMTEVRSDDDADWYDDDDEFAELKVSKRIRKYFTDRGYGYLGEGRDQMAFLSPRGTVLKILGIGEDEREDVVKRYVGFFARNQRNPHYPRIYNAGDFTVDGESYFIYEMEYLHPVSGEDRVLEYIEDLMSAIPYGEQALYAFHKNKPRPPELSAEQVDGLIVATQDLEDALGGQAPLDLRAIENLGRRDNGQIVIIDPFSL
jgi:GNAT superfamily N-acetyltransferase